MSERHCLNCGRELNDSERLLRLCPECWYASQGAAASQHDVKELGRRAMQFSLASWPVWAIADLAAFVILVPLFLIQLQIRPPGADAWGLLIVIGLGIAVLLLSIAAIIDGSVKLRRGSKRGAFYSLAVGVLAPIHLVILFSAATR